MPGAQVSILTRSGTNQFHGALFDFFRNDILDARNWFANANSLPKPELRQNDFGGALGGPVLLPKLFDGRNRTFFFFSYEGLRLLQPQVETTDVPSLESRAAASDALQPYLDSFPLPNRPDGRYGFAPFVATYTDRSSLDATSLRIDHALNNHVSLFRPLQLCAVARDREAVRAEQPYRHHRRYNHSYARRDVSDHPRTHQRAALELQPLDW
jgi:hypothetical protein